MKVTEYKPDQDIPSLKGKVFFVTGGTAGLGKETVLRLAQHGPAHIYFSGRNKAKAEALIAQAGATSSVPITFVHCDLASLPSVHEAGRKFAAQTTRLDVLMCNAGIMAVPAATTADGYEVQFGTNHVGHALLIKMLLPVLQKTAALPGADVRIVSNTSLGYQLAPGPGIDFDKLATSHDLGFGGRWYRYGQSKLANILYTMALAEHYPAVTSLVIHPGVIKTDLVNDLGFWDRALVFVTTWHEQLTPEQGAFSQLWAATTAKDNVKNGMFYEPVGTEGRRNKHLADDNLRKELWDWTQKQLEAYPN